MHFDQVVEQLNHPRANTHTQYSSLILLLYSSYCLINSLVATPLFSLYFWIFYLCKSSRDLICICVGSDTNSHVVDCRRSAVDGSGAKEADTRCNANWRQCKHHVLTQARIDDFTVSVSRQIQTAFELAAGCWLYLKGDVKIRQFGRKRNSSKLGRWLQAHNYWCVNRKSTCITVSIICK